MFKKKINTSSVILIIYFIMPNQITLYNFLYFVLFSDLKIHTFEFAEKIHLALETVSWSPQFSVDCMMVKTYQLLDTQRSSGRHLSSALLPSHNIWNRIYSQHPEPIYSLLIGNLWPIQGLSNSSLRVHQ